MSFWKARSKAKPKAKYGNKTTVGCAYGYSHRSKLEAAVCQLVFLRERAGELEHLQHESHVRLTDAAITYIPDFKCRDTATQEEFYIEAKGFETPEWRLKKRLWKVYGPSRLEVWGGYHTRPQLMETIVPKRSSEVKDGTP